MIPMDITNSPSDLRPDEEKRNEAEAHVSASDMDAKLSSPTSNNVTQSSDNRDRNSTNIMPSTTLSTMDARRQRNREYMQRVRQRQKEVMIELNAKVAELEATYQELFADNPISPSGGISTESEAQSNSESSRRPLESQYSRATRLILRLKAEKFMLQQQLENQRQVAHRISDILGTFHTNPSHNPRVEGILRNGDHASLLIELEYNPISLDYANHLMNGYAAYMHSFPWHASVTSSSAFGWHADIYNLDHAFGFFTHLTKTFTDQNAEQLMLQSWNTNLNDSRQLQYKHLQDLSPDILVAISDTTDPNLDRAYRCYRTQFLRFRMRTSDSFVIGQYCMNPTNPAERERLELKAGIKYMDFSLWMEFQKIIDPFTNTDSCRIKVGIFTPIQIAKDIGAAVLFSINNLMVWEQTVLGTGGVELRDKNDV